MARSKDLVHFLTSVWALSLICHIFITFNSGLGETTQHLAHLRLQKVCERADSPRHTCHGHLPRFSRLSCPHPHPEPSFVRTNKGFGQEWQPVNVNSGNSSACKVPGRISAEGSTLTCRLQRNEVHRPLGTAGSEGGWRWDGWVSHQLRQDREAVSSLLTTNKLQGRTLGLRPL